MGKERGVKLSRDHESHYCLATWTFCLLFIRCYHAIPPRTAIRRCREGQREADSLLAVGHATAVTLAVTMLSGADKERVFVILQ